jgi:hypothetical protein
VIAILAKLMGQNQLEAIAHWAKLRTVALCQLLRLEKERMPHQTTWGRILGEGLVVEELEELLKEFFSEQLDPEIPQRGQVVVSIDGKTLRGTIPCILQEKNGTCSLCVNQGTASGGLS